MHDWLERLRSLSILPAKQMQEIEKARKALRSHSPIPPRAEALLHDASVLAELSAGIAGSGSRLALSWLVCFVAVRLLRSTWNLPPGPWWTWGLLLDFDASALAYACVLLVAVVAVPIALCLLTARYVHSLLQNAQALRLRPLPVAAAALALVLTGVGWCATGGSNAAGSDCAGGWEPRPLGQAWWLLQCPSDEHGTACRFDRGLTELDTVAAGQRLIVPASQLLRIDFLPNPTQCASQVHLARSESVPAALPLQMIRVQVDPGTSANPGVLSLDLPTLLAIHDLSASLTSLGEHIPPRLDLKVTLPKPAEPSPTKAPDLQPLVDTLRTYLPGLVNTHADENAIADDALLVMAKCDAERGAGGFGDRVKVGASGDAACLDALKQMQARFASRLAQKHGQMEAQK